MLKTRLILTALLSIAAVPAQAANAPASSNTGVTLSPIGGHLMGNANAPTKVVEYVSYTCSHCAHFVEEASVPLRTQYVPRGKISVEVRNAVRDKYDLTAALLARCGGPTRFMGNHEALFANQSAWMDQVIAYDRGGAKPSDEKAALRDIGEKTGLYRLMARRGFTPAQLNSCINDPQSMRSILAMTDEAWKKVQLTGTPGFTINGKLVEGSSWDALRAALPPVNR